jgi:hypothetical protein
MDLSDLAQVLADIDKIQIRAGSTLAGLAYDELAREIMARAGRTYWVLTYHGETGPDSTSGGWDTAEDAAGALHTERAKIRARKLTILDPARLVATKVTTIKTETDEDW